jgi:predicted esterase YcpF (UPF0227 family)
MANYLPCVINLLTSRNIWYFQKERLNIEKSKIELDIEYEALKNYYIIYGNSTIKQNKPSFNLIDISLFSELLLKIDILKKTDLKFSLFIQLFDENSLINSTEYSCSSGENSISISKYHANIKFMKILLKIKTLENRVSLIIDSLDLLVTSYVSQIPPIEMKQENLIPNIIHQELTIDEGEKTYRKVINQFSFNFYLNYKKNKKLLIMFPGTTNRAKGIYDFQRYTWSNNIDSSLMIFLDPTIKEDNSLSIGWFQGNSNYYALLGIIDIIQKFIKEKKIEESDVVLFGSSGGGFSSLQLANYFPLASIVVINPQIKLSNFYQNEYQEMLDYSFKNITREELDRLYSSRLEVSIDFFYRKEIIYYYQNISDEYHFDNHLTPFLKILDKKYFQIVKEGEILEKDKKLYILLFNDTKIGHTPPNKNKSLGMIHNILKNRFKQGMIWFYSGEKIMESINKSLEFIQKNWSFNVDEYIKDRTFYNGGVRVELNEKLGSFYMILGSRYINAMPNSKFDISEFNKISILCSLSIINVDLKFYILEFSDKEKISTNMYQFKDGENEIEHSLNRDSLYFKVAFRIESLEPYSRFIIERLNIDFKFNKNIALPSMEYKRDSLEFTFGESTYSFLEDGIGFDFYLNYKKGKKILIGLPGAIDRKKRIYNFQRYSWSKDVDYSFMSILDPTIHEKNELDIGWFQGKFNNYPLPKLVSLLKKLFIKNDINEEDVLFFGSSAGGFIALQLSNFFPLSKIVVINPQIYIDRYYKSKYTQLTSYSYKGMSHTEIKAKFNNRISVDIDFSKRIAPIFYYQNREDKHHVTHHLSRYLETLDKEVVEEVTIYDGLDVNKKIYVISYSDSDKKHTPPNQEETLKIIENAFMQTSRR